MAKNVLKTYQPDRISLQHNQKTGEAGTIDIFRGCLGCEMKNAPCYAAKGAQRTGINFFKPVKREFSESYLSHQLSKYPIDWVRIGCISDPSLDWETTFKVIKVVNSFQKKSVVITKLYNYPNKDIVNHLAKHHTYLQVSVCGLTPARMIHMRERLILEARDKGTPVGWRINSAIWKQGSKEEDVQRQLITFARTNKINILDTPIRLFKTSPFWNHVNQEMYHRHLSPISGKLDNQRCAGLIIPNSFACYSTCSKFPTIHDNFGCKHQCLTRI